MKKPFIRGVFSLLGVALGLGWWTFGPTGKSVPSENRIPAKVGAGGQTLEIDAESSSPATMSVSFEDLSKPLGEQRLLNSQEKIPAGSKSWSVDVPSGVGGYIELDADQPKVGDTVTVRIHINGRLVDTQTDKLDQPLQANEAFFVQDHFDDYSTAEPQDAEQ